VSPIAVVVFAKAPRVGAVKTRLCPPLSPAQAARLYRCFLLDTLERVGAMGDVTPVVAYTPRRARAFFAAARPATLLVPQGGGDLGARMAHVFERLFARGFAAVVIVGADSPTLPLRHLRAAVRLVGRATVDGVIGPSEDGGYYLIGLRAPCPALFARVSWSTGGVLAQTLAKAQRAGRRLRRLPSWYDVDTVADLRRLAAELRGPHGAAPRTRRLLGARAWRATLRAGGHEHGDVNAARMGESGPRP
jgi:rSAM/selenodomain-associated transferase 1